MPWLWILQEVCQVMNDGPIYHVILEVCLVMLVLWLLFRKSYNPLDAQELTDAEKEEIIREWKPEPLVDSIPENHRALNPRLINGKVGKYVMIDGQECLNMATHNFLGFVENKEMEETAIKCLEKYGVGSCGPRGFYGTVDVHLELEEKLAKFVNMEEAVVYSYGFSTIASAIPAYSKRADLIFVDEYVNFAIQKGLDASRSTIRFFKHNDMEDLERLLEDQARQDILKPKKAKVTRRFLVVEGIYMNTGNIAPLPKLIELRKKYKLRIFIDESLSLGTLGRTGRGITEYFNIPVEEVDLLSSSLEWSVASIGGFCAGSSFIVEHQRLSGLGYCFSASLPPLLASAAIKALDIMRENPSLFLDLKGKCHMVHKSLGSIQGLTLEGHEDSPVKHLYLSVPCKTREEETDKLSSIVEYGLRCGVALTLPSYLEDKEVKLPRPSLRIAVNVLLTEEEILKVKNVIIKACEDVL
ncbi:serine palmitoyltransferase 1 [Ischnura elegans]|uniref:serine palmitoyltransferase 1 n=1 Tax=Ischnura elegans TaxID=197161 RepID=UPI001ED8B976|nr:serine palmitoyltransferase 1 [Ischnura elegans]